MDTNMKAGLARVDITPTQPVELCGYGFYLKRVLSGVNDPLFARALALQWDNVQTVIVSCDLIGLSREVTGEVKTAITEAIGLPSEAVMLHCTHTHTGPATDRQLRGCGVADEKYVKKLTPKIVQAARKAVRDLKQVTSVEYAEAEIEGIAGNRTYGKDGPLDKMVRSVFIQRRGKVPIVISNYGCHPVSNGCKDLVSADYPGTLTSVLDSKGYESMFITGFCGDIDPEGGPRGYDHSAAQGKILAKAVLQSAKKATPLDVNGIHFGERKIRLPYQVPSDADLLAEIRRAKNVLENKFDSTVDIQSISWRSDAMAVKADPKFKPYAETTVQVIEFGEVALMAFPGETFTEFGLRLREQFPSLRMFTVNCANGIVGYIPTPDEFDRKGYAAYQAAGIYDNFQFQPDFGNKICDEAAVLMKKVCTRGEKV